MSLLVAFTLDPMLSSRFVRFIPLEERTRTRTGRFLERVGGFYDRIDRRITACWRGRWRIPGRSSPRRRVVFFASLSTLSVIGTEFVPSEDRGEFVVNVEVPPGTAFEQTVAYVEQVEQVVEAVPEVRQIFSTVGFEGSPLKASLRVKAGKKDERERKLEDIKADMRARLKQIPLLQDDGRRSGVHAGRADAGAAQRLPARRRHGRTAAAQRRGRAQVKAVPGAVDVDSTLETGQPEMVAHVNRELAADLGFDVGSVAMQLRGMVEGIVPTRLREDDKEYDIRVRLAPEFRNDFEAIARTPLYSPTGAVVRTRDIVRMQPEVGPAAIEREQRRAAGQDRHRAVRSRARRRHRRRREGDGAASDAAELRVGLRRRRRDDAGVGGGDGLALLLAVAFIYIVLASQFESFLEPFLIMLAAARAGRRAARRFCSPARTSACPR